MDQYSQKEVISYSLKIPKELLDNFRLIVRSEGYSIQDALILLINKYVKDNKS